MKNQDYFKRKNKNPHIKIHNIFNIALQHDTIPFYQLMMSMDAFDIKQILPNMKIKKIQKAITENKLGQLLNDNEMFGFIAEVSTHIEDKEYCNVVYSECYEDLIDKIFKASEDLIIEDRKNKEQRKNEEAI